MSYHRFAAFSSVFVFFVLFAGGLVTSTGSGLAVPDWPLSYGTMTPRMVGGVFFEHGHRVLAGIAAVLSWVLAVWVHLSDQRGLPRRVSLAAAFAIALQAVLGGVTVLYGLPPQVSAVHAVLGQALFCALLILTQTSSKWYLEDSRLPGGSLWRLGALAAILLLVQLSLGAYLRHTGSGLTWHLLGAAAAFWAVSRAAYIGKSDGGPALESLSLFLMGALILQSFLGVGALLGRSSRAIGLWAVLPSAHQILGAMILGATVIWTFRAHRIGAVESAS